MKIVGFLGLILISLKFGDSSLLGIEIMPDAMTRTKFECIGENKTDVNEEMLNKTREAVQNNPTNEIGRFYLNDNFR